MVNSQTNKLQRISKLEMERKFVESSMEVRLAQCKPVPIKSSPNRIVVHRREWGFRYEALDGETVAIIFYYIGPDESEKRSIRLLVIEGVTYTLEAPTLPILGV
jgi:hypothetical protein